MRSCQVRTQQLSLDDDDRAMADLADVPDWRPLWGPAATGRDAVRALADRASAATGWRPWPLTDQTEVDDEQHAWGLVTRRDTVMLVLPDAVLPDSPRSGWSAYEIGAADLADAAAGLDAHWSVHLELARRHWGDPMFVGGVGDPRIPEAWRYRRRHLAVWLRPGAEFHLYAVQPEADSPTGAVGINYSVYASEVA
jgi:hypothetical protein